MKTSIVVSRTLCALWLGSWVSGCLNEKPSEESGDKVPVECETSACAARAAPLDWGSEATYVAHLRVVDALGNPVQGAEVRVNGSAATTDDAGRAALEGVSVHDTTPVRVSKKGKTPQLASTSPLKSGRSVQSVEMAPLGVEVKVDGEKRIVVAHEGAKVDVPPRALATPDGARTKEGRAQLTSLGSEKSHPSVMPVGRASTDEVGSPSALSEIHGALYVHFEDTSGTALNLAAGQAALITIPIDKAGANDGDSLPLHSLDEKTGAWKKEGSCRIETRTVGTHSQQVCTGSVSHFSYWAAASEVDIYEPGSVGCVMSKATLPRDACYRVSLQSERLYRCDDQGEACHETSFSRYAFVAQEAEDAGWCGVLGVDASTYRVLLVYDVDASACPEGSDPPLSGRRTLLSSPVRVDSFQDVIGSNLMLNFTLQPAKDCVELCVQMELAVDDAALRAGPVWIDGDEDGYFVSTSAEASPLPGEPLDCDDADARVHPRAPEAFCIAEDRNCDGKVAQAVESYRDVPDARTWNSFCGLCAALEDSTLELVSEISGNAYDENCDGVVADRDNDGFTAPEDCDDGDPSVNPTRAEVAGNFTDENCDGATLDADDDGLYAPAHVYLAEALSLSTDVFVDCDDYDAAVNPRTRPADEAGALGIYYYESEGIMRRRASFCSLFDLDGRPNARFHQVVRDLSCDGRVSDADGDGFTAIGDLSLGAELALDCDDLDPRVAPIMGGEPSCEVPAQLVNDSTCEVSLAPAASACPVLTLTGTVLATACEESKEQDGTGTGLGVCAFPGWWDGNPLSINPETPWGPCDGDGGLPECPQGSSCGGPLPYTDAFSRYIERVHLEGAPLSFKGMCFPACTP